MDSSKKAKEEPSSLSLPKITSISDEAIVDIFSIMWQLYLNFVNFQIFCCGIFSVSGLIPVFIDHKESNFCTVHRTTDSAEFFKCRNYVCRNPAPRTTYAQKFCTSLRRNYVCRNPALRTTYAQKFCTSLRRNYVAGILRYVLWWDNIIAI
jgi:hypothetical protein